MHRYIAVAVLLWVVRAQAVEGTVYRVECDQDTDVTSGTQWANQNKTNQGVNYLIEPIIANDGYGTKHVCYLGFDLSSNSDLVQGLANGEEVVAYKLWAYSDHNFAQGNAVIRDVKTDIYYVSNDQWKEGSYWTWTVINSSNPLDGMTWDNQVGYGNFLTTEYQNDYKGWYSWDVSPASFSVTGQKDNPNYLTLAMVPNGISKTSQWWLVAAFASTEYHTTVPVDYKGNLVPYLEVTTTETNRAPVSNAGQDQIVEATGILTEVILDGSGSSDADNDPLTYTWTWDGGSDTGINPTILLPLGTTIITLVVNDGRVNSTPDTVDVTVEDTTPPVIGDPIPFQLWPPNHKMVIINVPVDDLVDAVPTVTISNMKEIDTSRVKGAGGQNHEPDMVISSDEYGNDVVILRAERSGLGGSRVYTFDVTAVDDSGNVVTRTLSVTVGHDRRR